MEKNIKVRTGSKELDMKIRFDKIRVKVAYDRLLKPKKGSADVKQIVVRAEMHIDGDLSVFRMWDIYMDNFEVKWIYVGDGKFNSVGNMVELFSTDIEFMFYYGN